MTDRAFALAILLTCSAIGSAGFAHGAPAPTHPAPPSAYGTLGPARTSAIDRPTDARHFSGGSQGRLVVTSNDSAAMPNEGLRLNMTPFTEAPLPADASFQAAVEETIGNHDAVFGMFVTTGAAPVPFFSVFSNTTDATEHLAYWPAATPTLEGTFDFELTRTNSTVWTLDVNHGLFGGNTTAGTFDFGANASTWLPGLTFSEIALYPSVTSAPDTLSVPLAFAVLKPSGWYLPNDSQARFSPTGGAGWGIEGRLQHPTLPPGMLVSGTTLAPVPDGTVLWSGGPIAVSVALDAPAQALGLSVVGGLVTVAASGAPIPGATVYLHDALGSNFTSPSVVTGANGSVPFQIYTANVTAMSADTVSATVTTFGYPGGAGVAITLDPAVHLAVAPVHAAPTVGPGGTLQVAFVATEPDGSPAAGVYLTFATDAGSVAPLYALTGADGSASTTFTAPNSTEGVTIRAQVSGGGEWGEASVNVTVKPPTPPLLSPLEIDVVGLALFGALLIGTGLLVRGQRARRPPVPPMRFPKRTAPSAPLPAPTEGPGPAPNRTPPGSGAP